MSPADRRQRALVQAGLALASELSLPALLQKIVEAACEVSGARYGALGVVGSDGNIADFLTHGVSDEQRRAIGPLPHGGGILGVLIREAKPLRLKRIADDPRSVGFPPNHPPMHTFLGVPLAVRGVVFGNLYLTEKEGGEGFTQEDEDAVVTLAAQAAVAIDNARLHEEVQRLVVVEERERIAKELHDDIVQSLFAEGMALQAARSVVGDPVAVDARLAQAVDNLDRVIRDLRNYIFGLRPGAMADRYLRQAIRDLAAGYEDSAPAVIDVEVEAEAASLLAGRSNDVMQAAREALSNAVRHSKAAHISIRLGRSDGATVLTVTDDGVGFEADGAVGKGQGLGNLLERAAALGGSLEIDAAPGRGTRVEIRIPD